VESCGGCVAIGKGMNCLDIPGVRGVGCDGGKCKVFGCQKGWEQTSVNTCAPAEKSR
ncbi:hypothetical protein BT69DRAFT_1231428, partial [Atractiella rhizophila]